MAWEEVLQVWEGVQTAAAWGAGLPAEAFPPQESFVEYLLLEVISGRPQEAGWAYP